MVTGSSFAHLDVGYNIRQSIQSRPSIRPEIHVLQCMVFLFPFFISLPVFDCVEEITSRGVNLGTRGDWLAVVRDVRSGTRASGWQIILAQHVIIQKIGG